MSDKDLAFRPYVIIPVGVLALLAPIAAPVAVAATIVGVAWLILALRGWSR